jgi:hypothetical protein
MRARAGELEEGAARVAMDKLRGLFDLFEDDDVLRVFEMREPADAAVARESPTDRHLGAADQRIEAWFQLFGGVAPTGYLGGTDGGTGRA